MFSDQMLISVLGSLIAFFIGAGLMHASHKAWGAYHRRILRAFWQALPSRRVYIMFGKWTTPAGEHGEREPVVNMADAITLGELRAFLTQYYDEVVITDREGAVDWHYPVILVGGPVVNPETRAVGERGVLPIWFLALPYHAASERCLGSTTGGDVFKPEFTPDGRLATDVGFVARFQEQTDHFVYVVAGCYGTGTLGVVRFLTSSHKLRVLGVKKTTKRVQAVIRSAVSGNDVVGTRLVHGTTW